MDRYDLALLVGEASGDLLGAELLSALPPLRILAVAGPKMRHYPIDLLLPMEKLQVMGFLDVLKAAPRLIASFRQIRREILKANPKAVVFIDYPGLHLRLAKSLRKAGYTGKLIHYVCPSVWAHGKGRIPFMARYLDLLLTLFPFEKQSFKETSLKVSYVGHPLAQKITQPSLPTNYLALFPGSRTSPIERNLPIQLKAAQHLLSLDPTLSIGVCIAHPEHEAKVRKLSSSLPVSFFYNAYELMRCAKVALATSGTVTLELALHRVPTLVNFVIRPLDLFIAQHLLRIKLPHYCIVNLLASKRIFPEYFGPELKEKKYFESLETHWFDPRKREEVLRGCDELRQLLGTKSASHEAAKEILSLLCLASTDLNPPS